MKLCNLESRRHLSDRRAVLKLETRPLPAPKASQVLIRVEAFGLNRSEMFTRQGFSPGVKFPRILGIEAVGTVEAAPGGEFKPGTTVATAMGGMGRDFDGGYAEYTMVPAGQVKAIVTNLPWETLGALPEMLQTAWGSGGDATHSRRYDLHWIGGGRNRRRARRYRLVPLQELVDQIAAGKMQVPIGKVFQLDEIVAAHQLMDSNKAGGKIVVLTP
jgi:NADPH:quinone reductase-like Zn-dependent oxidoreductase